MNRDAMVIYLRDVRDLEVARYRLNKMHGREGRAAKQKAADLRTPNYRSEPEEPEAETLAIGCGVISAIATVAFVGLILMGGLTGIFWIVLELICIALLGGPAVYIFSQIGPTAERNKKARKEYESKLAAVRAHNREVDAAMTSRRREADEVEAAWAKRSKHLRSELAKAEALLKQYYAMNVLPSQYRSLVPVCYIYEYMSTSQASLEDTLIHEHMENGFQRLEAKLDQVIAAVNDLIYETRVLRAENRAFAEAQAGRDRQMLQSLQRTEQNTLAAAQYAELAECNTRACAYFELATYLKD